MGFKVVEVQPTPNPNAAKFVLDRAVTEGPVSFFNAAAAQGNVLAEKLFAVEGVSSVLMLGDFVTVNKRTEANWREVSKGVQKVLAEAG